MAWLEPLVLWSHFLVSIGTQLPLQKWRTDLPDLEDCAALINRSSPPLVCARDKLIQVKFLHGIYYFPSWLFIMGRSALAKCPGCLLTTGIALHMFLECWVLQDYWRYILEFIESHLGTPRITHPETSLVWLVDGIPVNIATCNWLDF